MIPHMGPYLCGFCAELAAGAVPSSVSDESIPVMSSMSGAWYGNILGTSTISLPPAWVHPTPDEIAINSAAAAAVAHIEARICMEPQRNTRRSGRAVRHRAE